MIRGEVLACKNGKIYGWLADVSEPNRVIFGRAILDQENLGIIYANINLSQEFIIPVSGQHCFEVTIPNLWQKGTIVNLTISCFDGVGYHDILNEDVVYEPDHHEIDGYLESSENCCFVGWARSRSQPDRPVDISITVNDKLLCMFKADQYRPDLHKFGIGLGMHGFKIELIIPSELFHCIHKIELRSSFEQGSKFIGTWSPQITENLPATKENHTASNSIDAEVISAIGNKIVGWASLEEDDHILVIVDERYVGEVRPQGISFELCGRNAALLLFGFILDAPETLFNGTKRRVVLRSSKTGQKLKQQINHYQFLAKKSIIQNLDSSGHPSLPLHGVSPTWMPRPRLAIVAWDMTHNPVGRAFLLAEMAARTFDVQLVGPMFPAYGHEIWPPINKSNIEVIAFKAPTLKDFVMEAIEVASRIKCDHVIICKARIPSILLGLYIQRNNNCGLVLDIDDHELSFFPNCDPIDCGTLLEKLVNDESLINKPYSKPWTQYAEKLCSLFPDVIVSNYALKEKFGGIIVRHARNEKVFDPNLFDRTEVRREFNYKTSDKVILFLGTPRPHKGVFEIADALERLDDDNMVLCIIGSFTDSRISQRFSTYTKARIDFYPDQPWDALPRLVTMADYVFLLQDINSPIAKYQIPAKLTDALAMGVTVYASEVPPLRDVISTGAVIAIDQSEGLQTVLKRLTDAVVSKESSQRSRDFYLTELSYSVNHARLIESISRAKSRDSKVWEEFAPLFRLISRLVDDNIADGSLDIPRPSIIRHVAPDLIFLWKQNDSDIYGRRSDMICRYLLKNELVRKIVHFDAPMNIFDLKKQGSTVGVSASDQGRWVYSNTLKRFHELADTERMVRRTFVFKSDRSTDTLDDKILYNKDHYPDFIKNQLKRCGLSRETILWVSPVVYDYKVFSSIANPGLVVADIIDDQRQFPSRPETKRQIAEAYREILSDADFAFANCDPVKHSFSSLRPDIHVVPNGAEKFDLSSNWSSPEEFSSFSRPIFGYVGNLRDRIDLELIAKVAAAFPEGSVVLIGSAHGRPEVNELAKIPNVHLIGVKRYDDVAPFVKSFDVALVPHLRNSLSESMNPLKMYVYFSLGVPIVTTDVANIGDISPYASVATSHDDFIARLNEIVNGRFVAPTTAERELILSRVSWDTRVNDIWTILGTKNHRKGHTR